VFLPSPACCILVAMTPAIDVVAVPWDSGRRGFRMGAGPEAFLEDGLPELLRAAGHDVRVRVVASRDVSSPLASAVALATEVARAVHAARAAGRFPLILAGNCMTALGVVAGLHGDEPGVAWFDAHGDLNTPATSPSGFLDGMAVATLLGWCHAEAASAVPGFHPLDVQRVIMLGTRDLDAGESAAMMATGVRSLGPHRLASAEVVTEDLAGFAAPLACVYVHVDLDVLDPARHGPANGYASPDGVPREHVLRAIRVLAAQSRIAALTIASYDPAVDADGRVRDAARSLVVDVLASVTSRRSGTALSDGRLDPDPERAGRPAAGGP
jgi:arginase